MLRGNCSREISAYPLDRQRHPDKKYMIYTVSSLILRIMTLRATTYLLYLPPMGTSKNSRVGSAFFARLSLISSLSSVVVTAHPDTDSSNAISRAENLAPLRVGLVNIWNRLPSQTVDFSSLTRFRKSIEIIELDALAS